MIDKLHLLLKQIHQYTPSIILDVGAYKGIWTQTMKQIYPNSEYHLFEPIDYPELKEIQDVNVYNVLLADEEKEVKFYQMKNTGDSIYREKTHHFKDCEVLTKKTTTINQLLKHRLDDMSNIFLKVDVQGSEIPVMKGASRLYDKIDFVILEIPLFGQYNEGVSNFLEHIKYMESIGFIPFDILENHYFNGFNIQIDMLFINKNNKLNQSISNILQ